MRDNDKLISNLWDFAFLILAPLAGVVFGIVFAATAVVSVLRRMLK